MIDVYSFTKPPSTRVISEIMMEAIKAVPKPSMTKEDPINAWVAISVMALITSRNNPIVKIVIGKVRMIRIGFKSTFNIARMILANIAVPIPSI